MNKEELFYTIKADLEKNLAFLPDKPEENVESTLKALWLKAYGISKSCEEAVKSTLPELTEQQISILNQFIEQRLNNIPLAYITGRQNFMGIEFITDRRALIPRKETEILGKKALALSKNMSAIQDKINVIDVCCGAGNLGLAIAYLNPKAIVNSTDLSAEAVELTQENVSFLNLNNRIVVKQGDLLSAFENNAHYEQIDLVVCNPPYISSTKVQKMNPEISANEPILAFDGGMFGTTVIQKLLSEAPKFLKKNGWVIFEIGAGQGEFIRKLCEKSKFYDQVETESDEIGNIRVILAKKA